MNIGSVQARALPQKLSQDANYKDATCNDLHSFSFRYVSVYAAMECIRYLKRLLTTVCLNS